MRRRNDPRAGRFGDAHLRQAETCHVRVHVYDVGGDAL
jgi:hypothetical protein